MMTITEDQMRHILSSFAGPYYVLPDGDNVKRDRVVRYATENFNAHFGEQLTALNNQTLGEGKHGL